MLFYEDVVAIVNFIVIAKLVYKSHGHVTLDF